MKNTVCMNCGSKSLYQFIDLGDQPNGNHFPSAAERDQELFFPFSMLACEDCWQVQIEEFPSPDFMFSNHPYITGVNMPVVEHFENLVSWVLDRFEPPKNSLVIDIGCNDGTLLKAFQQRGMRVLGVDPGQRTGRLCRANGITVCETFWNEESARALRLLNVRPSIITATAVFYHVEDIHSFVRGLREVMDSKTVFVAQCVYLKDVIEKLQFDHFYHEHTMIHAIAPLKELFARYGMRLLDVDFCDVHGGSFVLYVGLESSPYPTSPRIEEAVESEKAAGLQSLETYKEFTRKVEKNRSDLVALLKRLKEEGKRVYALGAPLKGSTLLNYCQIGPSLVECASEVNEFKIGKFTPGTHIPIVNEKELSEHPDYYLLLSWNFADFFVKKYSEYLSKGGRFILPHPTVRMVGTQGQTVL